MALQTLPPAHGALGFETANAVFATTRGITLWMEPFLEKRLWPMELRMSLVLEWAESENRPLLGIQWGKSILEKTRGMLSIIVLGFLSLSKKLCPTITVNSVTPSGTSPGTLFTSVLVPSYKCLGVEAVPFTSMVFILSKCGGIRTQGKATEQLQGVGKGLHSTKMFVIIHHPVGYYSWL